MDNGELRFDLPDDQGTFRGKFAAKNIIGHWFRPGTEINGGSASPVFLQPDGTMRWRGEIVPLEDNFTLYLMVTPRSDGSMGVVLRNPERDFGGQIGAERLIRTGNVVRLIGKRRGQKEDRELATGIFDPENRMFTLSLPDGGGSWDFRPDGDESDFYPRGKTPDRYVYRRPLERDDGWPTADLADVQIDRAIIEKYVQSVIDEQQTTINTPQTHGLLVARHGKLVLEEYFHGFYRDALHNTRSASKSVTATIIGAAIHAGAPLSESSPVYEIMNGGTFPADLEAGKRAMTLANLMTMSSGFFCDDNNDKAPGNENGMWEQTGEPDFYRFYMKVPLDRRPGEKAVYCSGDPNLALGMVERSMGENPMYVFDRLIAGPMKIRRYAWALDGAKQPFGGGGMQLQLRDFAKFGQLMLNGGMWGGRRILSRDFVARASSPLRDLGTRKYGYLWWGEDFPYKHRTVHAFMALGTGGQIVMVLPELDLVMAAYSGSFASLGYKRSLVASELLPAIR
jgi:CubicO group peptidase (beta-lactamase class C family)